MNFSRSHGCRVTPGMTPGSVPILEPGFKTKTTPHMKAARATLKDRRALIAAWEREYQRTTGNVPAAGHCRLGGKGWYYIGSNALRRGDMEKAVATLKTRPDVSDSPIANAAFQSMMPGTKHHTL